MRSVFAGLLPAVCLALLSSAAVARAQSPDDEVDLVDGTTLHGHVTSQVPGSYVTIQTADGRSESIPWSQVKRVATASAPPIPTSPLTPTSTPASPPTSTTAEAPPAADDHVHPPPSVHFEAGVRLGYSFSNGDYYSGAAIGSSSAANALPGLRGSVPFTVDAGIRIGPYVFVGAFVQYALLDSSCFSAGNVSVSCSGHDIRGGVDVIAHIAPRGKVDPWLGAGIGHEWLELDLSASDAGSSAQASETFDGWNFADLMFGVDFHMGPSAAIGPYFELTSGSFASASASSSSTGTSTTSASGDIGSQSSHQWFTLGLRGTYEAM